MPDVHATLNAFKRVILAACKEEANRPLADSMKDALSNILSGSAFICKSVVAGRPVYHYERERERERGRVNESERERERERW